jgi:beta-glucosidase
VLVDDANETATIDGAEASFAEVLALAAGADSIVIMAGTIAEEGADRATFTDSSGQVLAQNAATGNTLDWYAPRSNSIATSGEANTARNSGTTAMIEAILAVQSGTGTPTHARTTLVLKDNAGVALPASLVGPSGPAILEVWFPGQEDGNIVADVLFGRSNPSGRLPVTMPYVGHGFLDRIDAAQFPGTIRGDDGMQAVTYSEQLAIGYRWYDSRPGSECPEVAGRNSCVAFPFGHGLSYTGFDYGTPRLDLEAGSGVWRASVPVTNVGERDGATVVQVYLSLPASANDHGHAQPPRRLVGFQRLELARGATAEAVVAIDPAASNHPLSVWSEQDRAWVTPEGTFTVWIGTSSSPADLVQAGTFEQ